MCMKVCEIFVAIVEGEKVFIPTNKIYIGLEV